VTKHTRLMRRGALYYFRCKVPSDLVEHYGKREITESLRTTDAREALRKVRSRSEQQEEEFDRIRAGRGVTELTDEMIVDLASQWHARQLAEDEEFRLKGYPPEVLDEDVINLQASDNVLRDSLARGDFTLIEATVDSVLAHAAITNLPKSSETYRKLCLRISKEAVLLRADLKGRNRGDPIDTPPIVEPKVSSKAPPKSSAGSTLADLLVRWEKERKPTPKALSEWSMVVRRFTELHKSLSVDLIEKHHVVSLEDTMVDDGAAPAAVRKHMGALASLLQLAVDNGLCVSNVAKGVRMRGSKVAVEARLPYDSA